MSKVAVIGAGAWGTTLSILLAEREHAVTLWIYEEEIARGMKVNRENRTFLPGFPIPENIEPTSDPAAVSEAELLFFVVPTQFSRSVAKKLAQYIKPSAIVVSAAKGVEHNTLKLPLQILEEELGGRPLCALSGPNLASEIARGLPAATVVAGLEEKNAMKVQEMLMLPRFRVYTNNDIVGVQLGGSLKNVIAISAGIVKGLSLGDNALAAMIVRGIAEMTRLGTALGARAETFHGLSGSGDLIVTCSSELSRNHQVGEQIAKGKKLPEILSGMKEVAEGVATAPAVVSLAKSYNVKMPIAQEVYNILYQHKNPYQALIELMTRTPTNE
jgi:glycerol-3-phosphate dehydrogenase (NAD(P)+)